MESIYRKLLDATIELMDEKGYHGTSIQMIADKVGVSKSTIFYHFKNKEGILLAILEDFVPPVVNIHPDRPGWLEGSPYKTTGSATRIPRKHNGIFDKEPRGQVIMDRKS